MTFNPAFVPMNTTDEDLIRDNAFVDDLVRQELARRLAAAIDARDALEEELRDLEGDHLMLEQQLDTLTERVAAQEALLQTSNDLLTGILSVLQGHNPAPVTLVETPETAPEDTPSDTAPETAPTIDDLREALIGYRDALVAEGQSSEDARAATIAVMTPFLPKGAKPTVNDIPEARYAEVIAACASETRAAA